MQFAREAWFSKHDNKNPFAIPEIQNKITQYWLDNFNVKHPMQIPENIAKMQEKYQEKHSVLNPAQLHYSELAFDVLNSKDKFSSYLMNTNAQQMATDLKVNVTTIYKHHAKFDLEIIKSNCSSYENEIVKWLNEQNINVEQHNRSICNGKELDILIPEYNLAIEFNGLYWHSDIYKDQNYHALKYKQCLDKNIRLLTIFEDEWHDSKETIKNHILHLCNKTHTTIGARKCNIQEINKSICKEFLKKYHIQGSLEKISISLGAFYNDKLIAVIVLTKINENKYDLSRYAITRENNYPGLFSKFLSYIKKNYLLIKEIITFADLRWSYGDVYLKTGFEIEKVLKPGYFYTDFLHRYHKFNFRKNRIAKKFNIDITGKTEKQLMVELGFARIWDCGKIKFKKIL